MVTAIFGTFLKPMIETAKNNLRGKVEVENEKMFLLAKAGVKNNIQTLQELNTPSFLGVYSGEPETPHPLHTLGGDKGGFITSKVWGEKKTTGEPEKKEPKTTGERPGKPSDNDTVSGG